MPGCAAVGCSNSSVKGFIMKRFPKDPERRKAWAATMRRDNWQPTDYSVLCETHFEENMWEKVRVDGTRKLKCNAIPTLYSFKTPVVHRKQPAERKIIFPALEEELPVICHTDPTHNTQSIVEETEIIRSSDDEVDLAYEVTTSNNIASHELLDRYRTEFRKLRTRNQKFKNVIRNLKRKVEVLENKVKKMNEQNDAEENAKLLKSVFHNDQISAIKQRSKRSIKWSCPTVKRALKLRFSCGNSGYEELLQENYPLPSIRTLQRHIQNLKFESGIQHEVFEFLKIKADLFKKQNSKDCVIVLDEMAITPSKLYDVSSKKYIGDVTLPEHTGNATHALVIMLGGITLRWKQVVAYYYTSDSVNGAVYEDILFKIIYETEKLGLNVVSITSDMGASNKALWKKWNVTAGRYSRTTNYIIHPFDSNRKVYILADVPHLFKNIKNMLMTNKTIHISDEIRDKNKLPTNIVSSQHIYDLIKHQENMRFKLAPKLSEEDMMPSHFRKMKVSASTHVVSHDVSSALKYLAEVLDKPEYLTTAWFIDTVEKWFALMTSRHPILALSKLQTHVYEESITFLEDFMKVFATMTVGYKSIWKPSQTGVLLSTQSILDLQYDFLNAKNYEFLLTSRFTQDCLENLFSVVRAKQVIPTALQFKNNLKLICVSQYLKNVSKGSYHKDEREFLSDFLNVIKRSEKKIYDPVVLPTTIVEDVPPLCISEMNSLYNVCGYLITSINRTSKTCKECLSSVGSKAACPSQFAKYSRIKCFKENNLFFCNYNTFEVFLHMEKIFRKNYDYVINQNVDLLKFYINEFQVINTKHILNCHNMSKKIFVRFTNFMLKIKGQKQLKKITNVFASKSAAIH